MKKENVFLLFLCLSLTGCIGSRISTIPAQVSHPVGTIALMTGGGLFADAIGIEISARGLQVFDTAVTSNLLVRLNLNEVEVTQPKGLSKLKDQGIDAILSARVASGYDGRPQSASTRITSTHTGQILAGIVWQNARAGAIGSAADGFARKGLAEAASEVADALMKSIRPRASIFKLLKF